MALPSLESVGFAQINSAVQAKDWFVLGTPSAFTHPIFSQKTEVSLPQFRLPFYLSSIISKIAPFFQTWIMA
jgi:hypothetical protein